MMANYHAVNGETMKTARSRYLDAYEEAIKAHEASLMAEDMELVALHLSWRTERVTSKRSCKMDLDEKWAQRINLCRQRATPVRIAYDASKRSCMDDLRTESATAASELSKGRRYCLDKGTELDTRAQKLVYTINHELQKDITKLEAKITEIKEERRRQTEKLNDDYKARRSSLKTAVQPLIQSLLSAIEKRQKVLDRERSVIAKDLRAVQATLTLVTSSIQTLGQDPTFRPGTPGLDPSSNVGGSGACACGCGRRRETRYPHQHPNGSFKSSFYPFGNWANCDRRQRTHERFEEQRWADESRRQREVDEDERRRHEEHVRREREERRRREEAEAQARAEREQAKRREEEEAREREEARRQREYEEKRREEERREREEEARRQRKYERREEERREREKEAARKRAEEDERRREDARRAEEEQSRREEEKRRRDEEQKRQGNQHSDNVGGEDAQNATGETGLDDDDRSGSTSSHSTAKGKANFVLKCWNKYVKAWASLVTSTHATLRFQEIPWPILPSRKHLLTTMTIVDILTRINKESIRAFLLAPEHLQSMSPKARIRKELLRFHPDKRVMWLGNVKDAEKEQVDEACKQVVLHLTDLLNTTA